jgi:hypothetical protein
MKKRILVFSIALATACSNNRGNEVIMEEAARIHNETMMLAVAVEQRINTYESDSMQMVERDSIVRWRTLFEVWEEDVVEVPGNEEHHAHAGHHHHDHTPPDVTAAQLLEIQQALAKRMADLSQRVHP